MATGSACLPICRPAVMAGRSACWPWCCWPQVLAWPAGCGAWAVAQGSDPRTRALPSLHLELFWIEKDSNVLTEDYPPVVLDLASSAEDLEHVRELFQE